MTTVTEFNMNERRLDAMAGLSVPEQQPYVDVVAFLDSLIIRRANRGERELAIPFAITQGLADILSVPYVSLTNQIREHYQNQDFAVTIDHTYILIGWGPTEEELQKIETKGINKIANGLADAYNKVLSDDQQAVENSEEEQDTETVGRFMTPDELDKVRESLGLKDNDEEDKPSPSVGATKFVRLAEEEEEEEEEEEVEVEPEPDTNEQDGPYDDLADKKHLRDVLSMSKEEMEDYFESMVSQVTDKAKEIDLENFPKSILNDARVIKVAHLGRTHSKNLANRMRRAMEAFKEEGE